MKKVFDDEELEGARSSASPSAAAGNGLGTAITYPRRLKNGFSGSGLGTTTTYL
jgi:hypothetical protein